MNRNKGVSLITLMITIILMAILIGVIILTISNSNINESANHATEQANLNTARQNLATKYNNWQMQHMYNDISLNDARGLMSLETYHLSTEKYEIAIDHVGIPYIRLKILTPTECSVVINTVPDGVTKSRIVSLDLHAVNAEKMYISENSIIPNGSEAGWIDYSTSGSYEITGNYGNKIIYAWYKSSEGGISDAVYDTVWYVSEDGIYISSAVNGARNTTSVGEQNGVEKGPIPVVITCMSTKKAEYSIDETNWVDLSELVSTVQVRKNNTTVYARYYYNPAEDKTSYTVNNVDNTAPSAPRVTTTYTPGTTSFTDVTLYLNSTDTAYDSDGVEARNEIAGILRMEYSLDNGTSWHEVLKDDEDLAVEVTQDGTHNYIFRAIDYAGNSSDTTEYTVTLNKSWMGNDIIIAHLPTTARNTVITGTQNEVACGKIDVTITFSKVQYAQYSMDGTNWIDASSTIEALQVDTNGTIYARYYNGISEAKRISHAIANVDNVAPSMPTLDFHGYVEGSISLEPVTISFNSTDTATSGATSGIAGIKKYQYKRGGRGTWYSTTSPLVVNNSASYYFRAIDYAGNVSGEVIANVYINTEWQTASKINVSHTPSTTARNTNTNPGGVRDSNIATGPISASIEYELTHDGLIKQYQIVPYGSSLSESSWQTATSATKTLNNVTGNCTIYARYTYNGTNGGNATDIVNNVDNIYPTLSSLTFEKNIRRYVCPIFEFEFGYPTDPSNCSQYEITEVAVEVNDSADSGTAYEYYDMFHCLMMPGFYKRFGGQISTDEGMQTNLHDSFELDIDKEYIGNFNIKLYDEAGNGVEDNLQIQ